MAKKRKRTSVASYVSQLDPASFNSPERNANDPHLNLSAYHPDFDTTALTDSDLDTYQSLLPQCLVHPSQFPPKLIKYWRHRFSLFSLYSSGCLLDEQSWYSVTPEAVAFRIAKRCATEKVVVDLFAGAGGNAIQFAMTCGRVIAIELDETKVQLGRWNARVYGVEDRITYVQGDSLELLRMLQERRKAKGKGKQAEAEEEEEGEIWNTLTAKDLADVDVVFLSPPWGGVDYAATQPVAESHNVAPPSFYSLSSITTIDGTTLFTAVTSAFQTSNIAYYLPRNTDLNQLAHLSSLIAPSLRTKTTPEETQLKIEYQYVNHGSKLSSLTAYYGSLVSEWDDHIDAWRQT